MDVVTIAAISALVGRYCRVTLLFLPLELQTLCFRQFARSGSGRTDHFDLVVILAIVVQGAVAHLIQEACTLLALLCLQKVCFCRLASGRGETTISTLLLGDPCLSWHGLLLLPRTTFANERALVAASDATDWAEGARDESASAGSVPPLELASQKKLEGRVAAWPHSFLPKLNGLSLPFC